MFTTVALTWLFCGALNECLMYIWARRSFDLLSFFVLLALGPIFLAAASLLMVTGYAVSFGPSTACAEYSLAGTNASYLEDSQIEELAMKTAGPRVATQRQSQDISSLAA